ncbi:MAG: 30S ribosomal protein S5 [Gammaproteobacteria bacterium]|nr:30S ribosomal protein S5 [Gammaproteobacteria bacterium]
MTKTDGNLERLIKVNRVSKTGKGGRRMSFSAIGVVGDGAGRVGIGHGKSNEVPPSIQKAMGNAGKNMVRVYLNGDTIFHKTIAKFGATKVIIMSAPEGTGIIACAALRSLFEVLGLKNVVAKVIGSANAINVVRAGLLALQSVKSPERMAEKRGKQVDEIIGG